MEDYHEYLQKPIEEIREDIFLRPDVFRDAPWYNDFCIYRAIGVCEPAQEHITDVRKALKLMGCDTHITKLNGKAFVCPGEREVPAKAPKRRDYER